MNPIRTNRDWIVTVQSRRDPNKRHSLNIQAESAYQARWLADKLSPDTRVIRIDECSHG
jgi:hypothetical protein